NRRTGAIRYVRVDLLVADGMSAAGVGRMDAGDGGGTAIGRVFDRVFFVCDGLARLLEQTLDLPQEHLIDLDVISRGADDDVRGMFVDSFQERCEIRLTELGCHTIPARVIHEIEIELERFGLLSIGEHDARPPMRAALKGLKNAV